MEFVFDCHQYSRKTKVKLIVFEFIDLVVIWWDQLVTSRRRNGKEVINTWEEIKTIMKKRFVPKHYYREVYNRLQSLSQGSKSIDKYFKKMKITIYD